jgi:hypothetical protein
VVLSLEDPKSLAETLDILGDAALVDDIGTSVAEFDAGGGTSLTQAEALALMTDR